MKFNVPEDMREQFAVSVQVSQALHRALQALMRSQCRSAEEFAQLMEPLAELAGRVMAPPEDMTLETATLDWDKLTPQQRVFVSLFAALGLITDGLAVATAGMMKFQNDPERN